MTVSPCSFNFNECEETVLPLVREIFLEHKHFDLLMIGRFEKRNSEFGVLTLDFGGFRRLSDACLSFFRRRGRSELFQSGGVSNFFEPPDWQSDVNVPQREDGSKGRGIPDVAANAAPERGYSIYLHGK
jgi:hypothetical protein